MANDFGQRLRDAIDDAKRRESTGDPIGWGHLDLLVSEAAGGGVPAGTVAETVTPVAEPAAAVDEPPAAPEAPAEEPAAVS